MSTEVIFKSHEIIQFVYFNKILSASQLLLINLIYRFSLEHLKRFEEIAQNAIDCLYLEKFIDNT